MQNTYTLKTKEKSENDLVTLIVTVVMQEVEQQGSSPHITEWIVLTDVKREESTGEAESIPIMWLNTLWPDHWDTLKQGRHRFQSPQAEEGT